MDQTHASTREKSEQSADSSVKMYSCSFCKKGFLNAQALGGHMNIHRKDRAKLIMQSLDNKSHDDVVPDKSSTDDDDHQLAEYGPDDDQQRRATKQSSQMLVESMPLITAEDKVRNISPNLLLEEKKIDELTQGKHSLPLELDLELRLGHRSQEGSTACPLRAENSLDI